MRRKKTTIVIFSVLILFLFSLTLASALVEPKEGRVVITGEESLASLLKYQGINQLSEPIITKNGDICYLYQPLHVFANSTFRFLGSDCKELRLYSGTYIRISGSAYFSDIKVTSADRNTNQPIIISRATYNQKRPHIYTDEANYVEIKNSEFSYLGSYTAIEGSTWGVSFWHLKSGLVSNSEFHHNYFGIYTWGTKNVTIQSSKFHDNIEYGMDFHDYSNNFVIQGNTVYNNGNHGIIFSKFCDNNKIVDNYVYDHTQGVFVKGVDHDYGVHAIMLHKDSNNNVISGNVLKNNYRAIFLYQSHNNLVEKNIILNDLGDGIYLDNSSHNQIKNNTALNTKGYGLYSFYSDNNEFKDNYFEKGSYFKKAVDGQEQGFVSSEKYVPEIIAAVNQEVNKKIQMKGQDQVLIVNNAGNNNGSKDQNLEQGSIAVTNSGSWNIVTSLSDFIDSKMYNFLAIALIAIIIFLVEVVYKYHKKGRSNRNQIKNRKNVKEEK